MSDTADTTATTDEAQSADIDLDLLNETL